MATELYNRPEPVNLGSGYEISILDLAQLIAGMTDYTGILRWNISKPNGQPRRALDTTRAEEAFGFVAQMPFDEGLYRTIEWFESTRNPVGKDAASTEMVG